MITREELLKSEEYWFELAQNSIFRMVTEYMNEKAINQSELAAELNVTKGYVSQIVNGNFNYTLRKMIQLSLALGKIPVIEFKPIEEVLADDKKKKFLTRDQDDYYSGRSSENIASE